MDQSHDTDVGAGPACALAQELFGTLSGAAGHTKPGRLTLRATELEVVDGMLVDRGTGATLARIVPGLTLDDVVHLVITSKTVAIAGDRVVTRCSGPCGATFALEAMGLRHVGGGVLRNQPQCPACRGRYRARR